MWLSDDPNVRELTTRCLLITGFCQFGFAAYMIFGGASRRGGDTLAVMVLNLSSTIFVRLLGGLIVGLWLNMGLAALWLVLAAELMIRGRSFTCVSCTAGGRKLEFELTHVWRNCSHKPRCINWRRTFANGGERWVSSASRRRRRRCIAIICATGSMTGRPGRCSICTIASTERTDPATYLPGAQSVICVAMNYHVPLEPVAGRAAHHGRIARYALGDDYHELIKSRLHELADWMRERSRRMRRRAAASIPRR